ncbi:MAG: serine/threonine-protein kinase [Gammaproteobacteria bacterium]|jgi:serine/threonine protein kinase
MQARVEDLLIAALTFEGDVSQYLNELCDDHDIKREVLSLYDAARHADGFLSQSPVHNITGVQLLNTDLAGERLGAYKLVRKLGQGGMGTVYLAERADGQYQQKVAIKLLSHRIDGTSVHHFKSERQILANMNHANIARLLDGGEDLQGLPYLVMELVDGEPIDVYCRNNILSFAERLNLFEQVCDAVQYAHSQGIIHRDLKPGNLYVTNQGQVKLLDFGIAKPATQEQANNLVPFTPAYAAPEQINGGVTNAATDVYSLGIVLTEILTGQRPDSENTPTTHRLRLPLIIDVYPGKLEHALSKATHKDNGKRFSSVYELRRALKNCQESPRFLMKSRLKFAFEQTILFVLTLLTICVWIFLVEQFAFMDNGVREKSALAAELCTKSI